MRAACVMLGWVIAGVGAMLRGFLILALGQEAAAEKDKRKRSKGRLRMVEGCALRLGVEEAGEGWRWRLECKQGGRVTEVQRRWGRRFS